MIKKSWGFVTKTMKKKVILHSICVRDATVVSIRPPLGTCKIIGLYARTTRNFYTQQILISRERNAKIITNSIKH